MAQLPLRTPVGEAGVGKIGQLGMGVAPADDGPLSSPQPYRRHTRMQEHVSTQIRVHILRTREENVRMRGSNRQLICTYVSSEYSCVYLGCTSCHKLEEMRPLR